MTARLLELAVIWAISDLIISVHKCRICYHCMARHEIQSSRIASVPVVASPASSLFVGLLKLLVYMAHSVAYPGGFSGCPEPPTWPCFF